MGADRGASAPDEARARLAALRRLLRPQRPAGRTPSPRPRTTTTPSSRPTTRLVEGFIALTTRAIEARIERGELDAARRAGGRAGAGPDAERLPRRLARPRARRPTPSACSTRSGRSGRGRCSRVGVSATRDAPPAGGPARPVAGGGRRPGAGRSRAAGCPRLATRARASGSRRPPSATRSAPRWWSCATRARSSCCATRSGAGRSRTRSSAWVERIDPRHARDGRAARPTWPPGRSGRAGWRRTPTGRCTSSSATTATGSPPTSSCSRTRELPAEPRPYNSFVVLRDGTLATKDFDRDLREPARRSSCSIRTRSSAAAADVSPRRAGDRAALGRRRRPLRGRRADRACGCAGTATALARDATWGGRYLHPGQQLRLGPGDRRRPAVVHGQRRARLRHDDARRRRGARAGAPASGCRSTTADDLERGRGLRRCRAAPSPTRRSYDAERRIAIAYDSANGVVQAFRFDERADAAVAPRALPRRPHGPVSPRPASSCCTTSSGPAFARTRAGRAVGRRATAVMRSAALRRLATRRQPRRGRRRSTSRPARSAAAPRCRAHAVGRLPGARLRPRPLLVHDDARSRGSRSREPARPAPAARRPAAIVALSTVGWPRPARRRGPADARRAGDGAPVRRLRRRRERRGPARAGRRGWRGRRVTLRGRAGGRRAASPATPRSTTSARYAVIDARRLLRRDGLELTPDGAARRRRRSPSWPRGRRRLPADRRAAFSAAAMRRAVARSPTGRSTASATRGALARARRRRAAGRRRGGAAARRARDAAPAASTTRPVAVVHGQWFFAHERLRADRAPPRRARLDGRAMSRTVDFFFSFRSPYSYLVGPARVRARRRARRRGRLPRRHPDGDARPVGAACQAAAHAARRQARGRPARACRSAASTTRSATARCAACWSPSTPTTPAACASSCSRASRAIWAEAVDVATDAGLRAVCERAGPGLGRVRRGARRPRDARAGRRQHRARCGDLGHWGVPGVRRSTASSTGARTASRTSSAPCASRRYDHRSRRRSSAGRAHHS